MKNGSLKESRDHCLQDVQGLIAGMKACRSRRNLSDIHQDAFKNGFLSNVLVANTLISMYGKFGSLKEARDVFENMQRRTVSSWNALILGYANYGQSDIALQLFVNMEHEGLILDTRTFVAVLRACDHSLGRYQRIKAVHLLASTLGCDSHVFVGNTLVDLYAKCKNMVDARKAFDLMEFHDQISWNALVLAYVENGQYEIALRLFSRIRHEANAVMFLAIFRACAENGEKLHKGEALHLLASSNGYDLDIHVESSIVAFYAKCGSMDMARLVFNQVTCPDAACWNALMLGYVENGDGSMVLRLFARMKHEQCQPSNFTYAIVLKACGILGALEFGTSIRDCISEWAFRHDTVLATCLLDLYAKCGSLFQAEQVFHDLLPNKDMISWNALMAGYSRQGNSKRTLDLFEKMRDSGLQPDEVTFSIILIACSHAGVVDKGMEYFESMSLKYGLNPDVDQFTCMIDVLGRANRLADAMFLLRKMHWNPNSVIWVTIMGACRKWKNVELGRLAFQSWTNMNTEVETGSAYILMQNIYKNRSLWDMKNGKNIKEHGCGECCWTSPAGDVHSFS